MHNNLGVLVHASLLQVANHDFPMRALGTQREVATGQNLQTTHSWLRQHEQSSSWITDGINVDMSINSRGLVKNKQ